MGNVVDVLVSLGTDNACVVVWLVCKSDEWKQHVAIPIVVIAETTFFIIRFWHGRGRRRRRGQESIAMLDTNPLIAVCYVPAYAFRVMLTRNRGFISTE